MKNTYTIFLFIFLISGCKNDRIKNSLIVEETDSLSYFFELANLDTLPFKKRYFYNQKILSIISRKKNDSLNRVNYFKVANRYYNMNAMDDYKKISLLIIKNSEKANDSLSLAKAYGYLGDYYGNKFISESAYGYYFKAEKIYLKLKDNVKIGKAILSKAVLQLNEKDYIGSEKSAFEALKFLRKTNDVELIYEANNILGIIYNDLSEYDKAIEFHNEALLIAKNSKIPEYQSEATSLNNIGAIYQKKKEYKQAIYYFNAALKKSNLLNEKPFLYAALKDNLGYSKFKLNQFDNLPDLFYEGLKIRDSLKVLPGIIGSKLNLSEYYAFETDTLKAISFAVDAYNLAKINNFAKDILSSLKQLSDIEPKKTALYSKEYIKISDSLQLAERKIRNKLARIEYETDELAIEKDSLIEQRKRLIYIALGIILIGIFIFVIRFQAAKNRELLLVQEQQQANEEIYQLMLTQQNKIEEVRQLEKKRIAQELHDGILGKLFGTRMHLGILNSKKDDNSISERIAFIDELKTLEQEIREISHDLNSEKTAVFNNFALMVSNFIETQKKICTADININVDPFIEWNQVGNTAKINLYRILQEAFQNINKYANAQKITITFAKTGSLIKLIIQDDGVGFNYSRKKKGIGLLNMDSRIKNSGGNMEIETSPGNGTLLTFELPIITT